MLRPGQIKATNTNLTNNKDMRNKLLLSALALLAASGLSAKHLTPQEALARAVASPESAGPAKAQAKARMTLYKTLPSADGEAVLYVFSGDGKAIVTPADDQVTPVLGYIDAKAEGEMPPAMEWWLSQYASQIENFTASSGTGTGLYISPASTTSDKAPIAPMLKTSWDQGEPYNKLCPLQNGQRCYTGCVATAGAQVMYYHRYPAKGTGVVTYNDEGITRTLDLSKQSFDWDNMLESYSGTYTTTQANAVAYLMQAVGYVANMNYSTLSSGAQTEFMIEQAKKYLGYNSKATVLLRDNYPLAEWENIIYEQLQKVGPVVYAGHDYSTGGHAFICDGYSSDGFFHFNWGWSGAYDGYFKLTALVPEGQGAGGNAGGFNFNQRIAVNFTTPTGATVDFPEESPIAFQGNMIGDIDTDTSVMLSSDYAQSRQELFFYNNSSETVSVLFALKAVNVSTGAEAIGPAEGPVDIQAGYGSDIAYLSIPDGLPDGHYNLYIVTRRPSSDKWLELVHNVSCSDHICVEIIGGIINEIYDVKGGALSLSDIKVISDAYVGYNLEFSYTVVNNGEYEALDGLRPVIFTTNATSTAVVQCIGSPVLYDLLPGESWSGKVMAKMEASGSGSGFSGQAYFGLASTTTSAVIAYIPITVKPAPSVLRVSSTGFSMEGDRNAADANDLRFNCGLKVNSGYWAEPLTVSISDGNIVLHTLKSEETFFLRAGQQASAMVAGSYPGAVQGQSYIAYFGYISGNSFMPLGQPVEFKVAIPYSGVESVSTDNAANAVNVNLDRATATLTVTAPSDIASIAVYTIDGRSVAATATVDGTTATASLSAAASGILLVKTTLTDGTTAIAKVVR